MTQNPSKPSDIDTRPTFDKQAISVMRGAAGTVLAAHPEVRSVFVGLDYTGNLNEAAVDRALWISETGDAVTSPAAIVGSISVLLKMAEMMFVRLSTVSLGIFQESTITARQLAILKEELENVRRESNDRRDAGLPA